MKNLTMKKRLFCLLMAFALVLAMPMTAFAASSAFDSSISITTNDGTEESATYLEESTGNNFFINHPVTGIETASDLYWVGNSLDSQNIKVGASGKGSLLAAGSTISFSNATVADSVRVAGQDLVFKNVVVGNNFTVAANSISFDAQTSGNGLYAFASSLNIQGHYNSVSATGSSIDISNLVVAGDVTLDAKTITINSSTQIAGTLYVPEDATLTIADGATITKQATLSNSFMSGLDEDTFGTPSVDFVQIVFSCIAHILLVGLIFWLMRETLDKFAECVKRNWGKTVVTGIVTIFVLPLLLVIGCIPLVTIPIVGLILLAMIVILFIAIPFTGAALGQLVFKNMSKLKAGIVLTVILTVIASMPYCMLATMFVCTIFTAGYIVQSLNELRKRRKMEKMQQPVAPATPSNQGPTD